MEVETAQAVEHRRVSRITFFLMSVAALLTVAGQSTVWGNAFGRVLPAADSAARIVCLDSVSGGPDAFVSVPLTLGNGDQVAAFQVDVSYDPDLLTPIATSLGADTSGAGGWSISSNVIQAGTLRVLGFTNPPAALGAGFKQLAIITFQISSQGTAANEPLPLDACVLGDEQATRLACATCVVPGIGTAIPRFAFVIVDDGRSFRPSRVAAEQATWVVWKHVGSSQAQTTTSGLPCVADGLWNADLAPGSRFTRRFLEPPATYPYFSAPQCVFGMVGEVEITPAIDLSADHGFGSLFLSWSGGSGLYGVVRSETPSFVGPSTATFSPDGGDGGTTFTDATEINPGMAHFYLVTNKNSLE